MYIFTKASRRGSSIFEIFSTGGRDHLVTRRNRWFVPGTEAGDRLARRMLKYLEDGESTKVGIRELEEQVLFPF